MLQWSSLTPMYQWNKNSLDAGEASCGSVLWLNQDLYSLTCADVMDGIMFSQNSYVELLTPVYQNVTVFGYGAFTEVIKIK